MEYVLDILNNEKGALEDERENYHHLYEEDALQALEDRWNEVVRAIVIIKRFNRHPANG